MDGRVKISTRVPARRKLTIYSRHAIFYFNLIVYLIVCIYIYEKIGSIDSTPKVEKQLEAIVLSTVELFSACEGIDEPTAPSTRLETTR